MVAAIGIAAGVYNYVLALGATLLLLVVLLPLSRFEYQMSASSSKD